MLKLDISTSLDGFIAGPNPSEENPLGEGGEGLHGWVLKLAAWRQPHGLDGGEVNESSAVVEEGLANVGAVLMGRKMFGPESGPWGDDPWRGWWGEEPPFHVPVFVLTHHPRQPLEMRGTTFHFVTEGIEAALEMATEAAAGRDVAIAGGAEVARQYLTAGLLDEINLNIAPILLGSGTPLFEGRVEARFEPVRAICTPDVTHVRYRLHGD